MADETAFRVLVTYTDRRRDADGRFRTSTTEVEVLAADDVEAVQLAAQMVDAVRAGIGGMVVATQIITEDGEQRS